MRIPRFYQKSEMQAGEELDLSPDNHRHAVQVLRLKLDEYVMLFNGDGGEYLAKLVVLGRRHSMVLIESYDSVERESPLEATLALAMIKPDKMDFAIQKAVELGVSFVQPMYTKRSVVKIKESRLDKKMQHWRGIIIAACEQSGRTRIPELLVPKSIDNILAKSANQDKLVMLIGGYPKVVDVQLNEQSMMLLIGPEGGFTPEEEQLMLESKVTPVNFGGRILRAETAAIAGLTACQQMWGDI